LCIAREVKYTLLFHPSLHQGLRKGEIALKETQEPESIESKSEELPAPQGIGMAVAVDWGVAVQIVVMPIIATIFGLPNVIKFPGSNSAPLLSFIIPWLFACIPAFFGEMIRRGRNWALWIQMVVSSLLSLGGILSLANLYRSVIAGNFWPLVTEVILVIISPLTVWRLSRPSTRRWFKTVTVAEARKRHGGTWIWFIMLWAMVGGILQAFAALNNR
jgi:hypothetical protein